MSEVARANKYLLNLQVTQPQYFYFSQTSGANLLCSRFPTNILDPRIKRIKNGFNTEFCVKHFFIPFLLTPPDPAEYSAP